MAFFNNNYHVYGDEDDTMDMSIDDEQPQCDVKGFAPAQHATRPGWQGPQQDARPSGANGDPFVGTKGHGRHKHQLSGDAREFVPGSLAAIHELSRNSVADYQYPLIVSGSGNAAASSNNAQLPIGTPDRDRNSSSLGSAFTTDSRRGPGHFMKIANAPVDHIKKTLDHLCEKQGWKEISFNSYGVQTNNSFITLFFKFDDLRNTTSAFRQLNDVDSSLTVVRIDHAEFVAPKEGEVSGAQQESPSLYDGQAVLKVHYKGKGALNSAAVKEKAAHAASKIGPVFAFVEIAPIGANRVYRVEFYSVRVAKKALKSTPDNPIVLQDLTIVFEEMEGVTKPANRRVEALSLGMKTPIKPGKTNIPAGTMRSPSGRTAWSIGANGKIIAEPTAMQLQLTKYSGATPGAEPAQHLGSTAGASSTGEHLGSATAAPATGGYTITTYGPPPGSLLAPETITPQDVVIPRIEAGLEVRTTIMLRNLPSTMTSSDMVEILNRWVRGRYDFSYLRIDFQTNTNVGYAFVNMVSPSDVAHFLTCVGGRPWMSSIPYGQRGPRIAQISFATVQGQDCLIEKFRNSAIMQENPDFIPKLWYSNDTAPAEFMIGMEQPFPPSNNLMKLERSRGNAGTIGLFTHAARRGGTGGDRRRSRFDRGTTAQIQEDLHYGPGSAPLAYGYGYRQGQMAAAPYAYAPVLNYPQVSQAPFQNHQPNGYYQANNGFPQVSGPGYPQANTGYPQANTGYPQANTGYPQPNTGYQQVSNNGYPQANGGHQQITNNYHYQAAQYAPQVFGWQNSTVPRVMHPESFQRFGQTTHANSGMLYAPSNQGNSQGYRPHSRQY